MNVTTTIVATHAGRRASVKLGRAGVRVTDTTTDRHRVPSYWTWGDVWDRRGRGASALLVGDACRRLGLNYEDPAAAPVVRAVDAAVRVHHALLQAATDAPIDT